MPLGNGNLVMDVRTAIKKGQTKAECIAKTINIRNKTVKIFIKVLSRTLGTLAYLL